MNKALANIIIVIVAAVLIASCVGACFALYSLDATDVVVHISATAPTPHTYRLAADWNSGSGDSANDMTYSAGVYATNDVTVAGGQTCTIYDATISSTVSATINGSSTAAATGGGASPIALTYSGVYDFSFSPQDGVTITVDSYYYLFECSYWSNTDYSNAAIVLAWMYGGSSDANCWRACTLLHDATDNGSADIWALPYTGTDHTMCVLVRFVPGTTPATANWDNKLSQSSDITLSRTGYTNARNYSM